MGSRVAAYDGTVRGEPVGAPGPRTAPGGAAGAKERLDWIDAGRGIAIVMVVLFHAANWLLAAGAQTSGWVELNTVVSSLRMPLFFTLSGLFAAKWVRGSWRRLLDVKVRLYGWVFLVWGLVGSTAFAVGVRMKGEGSLGTIVVPFLLSPVMPRLELWFIWALALFFVVAKATAKVPPVVQVAVALVGAAFALSGWETASVGWSGSVKYYVFFLAGMYGRDVVMRLGRTPRTGLLAAVTVAWAGVSLTLWLLGLRDVPGLYLVNCVLGVLAGIALARALSGVAVLRHVGSHTLPIYLAHTPLIVLTSVALHYTVPLAGPVVGWLLPPVVGALAIWAALRLRDVAQRHGAGFLYAPPRWFFGGRGA